MDRLLNTIKGFTGAQDAAVAQPRFGTVTSVDPQTNTVRVQMQPESVLSGWLPVLSQWVGSGWGLSCHPSVGDQVLVVPQEGDVENGIVIGCAWGDKKPPPSTPIGEFWITHQSGSYLRLLNDGSISINGNLRVQGDISDQHGSLSSLRDHYNGHTHAVPQGGRTDQPTSQD